MKKTLSWVLVLPVALAAMFATGLILHLFKSNWLPDWGWVTFFTQFAAALIMPSVFVMAGANMAPMHKFATALVLSILFAIAVTAFSVWALIQSQGQTEHGIWWVSVCAIEMIASLVFACFYVLEEERFKNKVNVDATARD